MTGNGTMVVASELVLGIDMTSRPSASTRRPHLSCGQILLGLLGLVAAFAAPDPAAAQPAALSKELIARGKYVFGVAAGCGCHTEPKKVATELNAGGRKYEGPFGTVYSTNITPDPRDGDRQMDGRPDHHGDSRGPTAQWRAAHPRAPVSDLQRHGGGGSARGGGLPRSVPPVRRANTPKKISVPMFESVFLPAWLAAFAPRETPPATAPTSGLARGEYLVRAVGHCGECHTPRGMTQALDNSRFLAGNPKGKGPEGSEVPNITPDKDTGIGKWTEEQIADVHRDRQSTQWRRRRRAHGRGH